MKKYYFRLVFSIEVIIITILDLLPLILTLIFKGKEDSIILIICLSLITLIILIFLFILFSECFKYVCVNDNILIYKSLLKRKIINLSEKIECLLVEKLYVDEFVLGPSTASSITKIVEIKSSNSTIEIPLKIYIKIQKDYPIFPEIEKIDSKNHNKYNTK